MDVWGRVRYCCYLDRGRIFGDRRTHAPVYLKVDGKEIVVSGRIKYLGIILGSAVSLKNYIVVVTAKLMPRIGGVEYGSRRMLALVANSVMLYTAPFWGGVINGC